MPGGTSSLSAPKHRLLLELGRGGMGSVYLAIAEGPAGFNKLKVVKQLRPELAAEPDFLQMFLDEARLAARLNHPNVVQTFEVAFDGQRFYLEMEYLEGDSLDAVLKRLRRSNRTIPHALGVWIVTQILAGLDHAHELCDISGKALEVVHRDVSPHNVFVTHEGVVKVLDFGIAKAADSHIETRSGVVKGKATYMSPEQAARRPVDRRTDIFAAGIILYEVLTGRRFWRELGDAEIFKELSSNEPMKGPRAVVADVPEALDEVVLRAIAKDAKERFPTANAMQLVLEDWLAGCGERAGPRQLAALMSDLFAERRAALRAQIESQVTRTAVEPGALVDVPLATSARDASDPSGRSTSAKLVAELAARGRASGSGTGNTSTRAATPRAHPAHPEGSLAAAEASVRRPRRARSLAIAGLVTFALVAGGAALTVRARAKHAASPPVAPVAHACSTRADCAGTHGAPPAVCRSGACVEIASEDCRLSVEPGEEWEEGLVPVGVLLPVSGPRAEYFGQADVNALELARRDFRMVGGLPATSDGQTRRLGLVVCDDATNAARAARHLVEIGVPAVLGFGSAQEALDVSGGVLLPAGAVAVNMISASPLITKLAQPKRGPRLVWRTTFNADHLAEALTHLVSDILEPRVHDPHGGLPARTPTKLALIRSARSSTTASSLASMLRLNGKSILENGDAFRQYTFRDDGGVADQGDVATVVDEVVRFAPHIIVYTDGDSFQEPFLEPLERKWSSPVRPLYASGAILEGELLRTVVGKDASRRHRFFGVELPANTPANLKFTLHYNEAFTPHISIGNAPGVVYDAFYVTAYAAAASDSAHLTGADVASGLARIRRDGLPIEVGPAAILDGFAALRAGKDIALDGAGTQLDLDPATGEDPSDFAVYCLGVRDDGTVGDAVESGIRFDHRAKTMLGTSTCP